MTLTKEQMRKSLSSQSNIEKFKSSIRKWIKNAKLNNQNLTERLYNAELFYKYHNMDDNLSNYLDTIIEKK